MISRDFSVIHIENKERLSYRSLKLKEHVLAWNAKPVDTVKSPCIGVCQLDKENKFCMGCFRTRDDIAMWTKASDNEKKAIIDSSKLRADKVLAEIKARKTAKLQNS